MPLRFVEVRLPAAFRDEVHAIDDSTIIDRWCLPAADTDVRRHEKENGSRQAKRAFLLGGVLLARFAAARGRIQGAW